MQEAPVNNKQKYDFLLKTLCKNEDASGDKHSLDNSSSINSSLWTNSQSCGAGLDAASHSRPSILRPSEFNLNKVEGPILNENLIFGNLN